MLDSVILDFVNEYFDGNRVWRATYTDHFFYARRVTDDERKT